MIICPICNKRFQSLGYPRHRTMHYENRESNPNNLKAGDEILIEQAWEDTAGQYHDEWAKVREIRANGKLILTFLVSNRKLKRFLYGMEYFAKDYKI